MDKVTINGKSSLFSQLGRFTYRSFCLAAYDSATGFRLGGMPPVGIRPPVVNGLTKYLLTVPVSDDIEISLFHSFDFESDGALNPYDVAYKLLEDENRLVQFVVHSRAERVLESDIVSDLPSVALCLSEETRIDGPYEDAEYYPFHKIGGGPVFRREFDSGIQKISEDILETHLQLIQLAFPVGPGDALIDADWPFGEAVFHVFAVLAESQIRFRYCWG